MFYSEFLQFTLSDSQRDRLLADTNDHEGVFKTFALDNLEEVTPEAVSGSDDVWYVGSIFPGTLTRVTSLQRACLDSAEIRIPMQEGFMCWFWRDYAEYLDRQGVATLYRWPALDSWLDQFTS